MFHLMTTCIIRLFQVCVYSFILSYGFNGQAAQRLKVSENHRFLTYEDGKPFFYLGDTAWELFHRTDRKEADLYLEDRASKGFTVIQAVALSEEEGLRVPNSYGHQPLLENDPARPAVLEGQQNDYWDHVDYIVQKAESLGMYIGMLPTWGDKWNLKWGVGPEVFTPENAEAYGEWLGKRYRDRAIIWILGGDRSVDTDTHRSIIESMAKGIRRGDDDRNLMTFHPQGQQNSADIFHQQDWLDFNMVQSGHGRPGRPNYWFNEKNLSLSPTKPTLDGEPCYEDHPVKDSKWNRRNEPGVLLDWFDEWDVRVAAYQSMLSGACGHTYGNHNIWQMWLPGRPEKSVARTPWPESLHHAGALHMKYFRNVFETRPFWKLEPYQKGVAQDNPEGPDHVRAARDTDGNFMLAYLPTGKTIHVGLSGINGKSIRAWWFNPRQNASQLIGDFQKTASRSFTPPTQGRNNDWLLVIDSVDAKLARLGSSYQNLIPKVRE